MAFEDLLNRFRSRLAERREARQLKGEKETVLKGAIERVLKASAPVMCTFRDCRHELRAPIEKALDYIQGTIDAIPGPVSLAPENWSCDPLLHALFVDAEEIRWLLKKDRRLRAFFAKGPAPRAFALLTASKRERTIFGTVLEGSIMRRDVPQTSVEFHDHRIVDPCATEIETRHALQDRTLNALVTQVLERLLAVRALKDELKEQQRLLAIKFKIQQSREMGLEALQSDEAAAEPSPPLAPQALTDIERQIRDLDAESDSPEEYLHQLTAVLSAPQQALIVTPIRLRLNWMGVKQSEAGADAGNDIRLAEVEFQNRLKRVAVFVTIQRPDSSTHEGRRD